MAKLIETLFYCGATRGAVLVTNRAGCRAKQAKRFADPHAALSWCISRGSAFVFTPGSSNRN
jgi:hypothetical protein